MKAQSVSIVVPAKKCINNCPFCVSKMHCEQYENYMDVNDSFFDLRLKDYLKRLEFCRNNGVNTVMLTGNAEPQQNRSFLTFFGMFNQMLKNPFECIEMQTTGTLLDRNYLRFLRNHVGVTTISLSISSFFDHINNEIIKPPKQIELEKLCVLIKEYGFNLRLSLNLNKNLLIENSNVKDIFTSIKMFLADQVTFRVLYTSGENTIQDKWIEENSLDKYYILKLKNYIVEYGRELRILEYGQKLYDVDGISVVLDDDCMNTEIKEDLKYLILREDCKLYSKWDSKASLIF